MTMSDEKLASMVDGFRKAVDWIERNKPPQLVGIFRDFEGGTQINLATIYSRDATREKAIAQMFEGKQATVTRYKDRMEFKVVEDGLKIKWVICISEPASEPVSELVTL